MGNINRYVEEVLTSGGGSYTYALVDGISLYKLAAATVTLVGNINIAFSGTPEDGMVIDFFYKGAITLSSHTFTIINKVITQEEALSPFWLRFTYSTGAGAWVGVLTRTNDSNYEGVYSRTLTNGGGTVTLQPRVDKQVQRIAGSPSLAGNWNITFGGTPVDGDSFEILYSATPTTNGFTVTIGGVVLTDAEATAGNMYIKCIYDGANSAWRNNCVAGETCTDDLCTALQYEVITYSVSFESGEKCSNIISIPYNCNLIDFNWYVTKAIAGTDNGTISIYIDGTPTNPATSTVPLSTPIDTIQHVDFISANSVVAGGLVSFATSKTTSGGKCLLSITIQRT